MSSITLSEQQSAILEFLRAGSGSGVVLARAGSGKTFIIKKMVAEIVARGLGVSYVGAFNRAIADSIKRDIEKMSISWADCAVNTAHGFGYGAIRRVWPKVRIDEKKVSLIVEGMAARVDLQPGRRPDQPNLLRQSSSVVAKLVGYAKQRGVGTTDTCLERADQNSVWESIIGHYGLDDLPDGVSVGNLISWAREALTLSEQQDSVVIDYDDMVLAPITHNLRIQQRNFVFVDEAQDTNPARRALFARMLLPGGRLFAVGDDRQAINGFAGADSDALDQIIRRFDAAVLPITTTYRCPRSVVSVARDIVPDIVAHDAADEGTVRIIDYDSDSPAPWFNFDDGPRAGDAVLCRTSFHLVSTAFAMIRRGITCFVEGRDIGMGLMALARRWNGVKTISALMTRLKKFEEQETKKWMDKGREDMAESVSDRVDTVRTICEWCTARGQTTIADLCAQIETMFYDADAPGDKNRKRVRKIDPARAITLSTIHKAKGREWDRVFFLRRNKCPSKWARADWEIHQEMNLIYVGVTRARRELYLMIDIAD